MTHLGDWLLGRPPLLRSAVEGGGGGGGCVFALEMSVKCWLILACLAFSISSALLWERIKCAWKPRSRASEPWSLVMDSGMHSAEFDNRAYTKLVWVCLEC